MEKNFQIEDGLYQVTVVKPSFDFLCGKYKNKIERKHISTDKWPFDGIFEFSDYEPIIKVEKNKAICIDTEEEIPIIQVERKGDLLVKYPGGVIDGYESSETLSFNTKEYEHSSLPFCILYIHDVERRKKIGSYSTEKPTDDFSFIRANSYGCGFGNIRRINEKNLFSQEDKHVKFIIDEYFNKKNTKKRNKARRKLDEYVEQVEKLKQKIYSWEEIPESFQSNIKVTDENKIKIFQKFFKSNNISNGKRK